MNDTAASARLDRLDGFLRQDPRNAALLADACDTAIACGAHERADGYLRMAQALADAGDWTFRRARLAIARRDLSAAAGLLAGLRGAGGDHPAVVHDLAYVHLLRGEFDACRRLLAPLLEEGATPPQAERQALQVLWLRALHRLGELDAAWSWVEQQRAARALDHAAQGVASLVALDLGDFDNAKALADAALAKDATQFEALVARGCIALALGDSGEAVALLQSALRHNPQDGRVWSALGMASLHARDLPLAQQQFERAVERMPDHIGTWHGLGWVRLLRGDQAGARAAFDSAMQRDRNFAESHGAVGLLLALQGDAQGARHHLDAADKLDPHNVTAHYARALLAGELRDVQRLQALLQRLLDRPGFFGRRLRDALPEPLRRR